MLLFARVSGPLAMALDWIASQGRSFHRNQYITFLCQEEGFGSPFWTAGQPISPTVPSRTSESTGPDHRGNLSWQHVEQEVGHHAPSLGHSESSQVENVASMLHIYKLALCYQLLDH
jgi:hypothetical protein